MKICINAIVRLASIVALILIATRGFAEARELLKITISYAATTGPTWPLYVAKTGGYYEKYGLDVNLVYGVHPAGIAMVVSGQAAMANYGLDQAMQAGFRDGSLVAYGSPYRKGLLALMVGKDIRRVSDLKGKRIGVRQIGDVLYTSTTALLAKAGLTPRDVHWLAVGLGGDALVAAIAGKRVDAALISAPGYFKLESQGFKSLVNLTDSENIYAPTVFLFKKAFVASNPQLPELLIKAHAEAINRIYEDKAFAIKTYLAFNREDPADMARVYDLYTKNNAYERVPYILAPAVEFMLSQPINAYMRNSNFRTVLDNSIVDRLVKEGFFEKLFGPGIKAEEERKAKIAFR
jgi:ABC-type nitrate/sulfonate/bicarbonate transport system substrate-binding protein